MALEDMIGRCIEAGVTSFELCGPTEMPDGELIGFWHWVIHRGDPVRSIGIPMPWDISVFWLGFGPNPNRFLGVMPFTIRCWPRWHLSVSTGGERNGWQMSERPTFEDGLRAALGTFLCDDEGADCPHEICQHYGTEDCDAGPM